MVSLVWVLDELFIGFAGRPVAVVCRELEDACETWEPAGRRHVGRVRGRARPPVSDHIKQWRGLATRYDKHATVYRADLFDRARARHRS